MRPVLLGQRQELSRRDEPVAVPERISASTPTISSVSSRTSGW